MTDLTPFVPSAMAGAAAGLRTFTPGAALSTGKVQVALGIMAALELIGDKLPFTPSRIAPGPLGARFVSGALCGAAVAARRKRQIWPGAILGGLAAVAAAYAGYYVRRGIVEDSGLPDMAVALTEDAVAIGIAVSLATR